MSKKKSHYSKTGLVFEELEPRLLLSADPLAVATDANASVQELVLENDEDHSTNVHASVEQSHTSVRNELVIIDSRAPNYQQLHDDLIRAQQQGRNIHMVVLDAHRDGIEQINEALESHSNLDAVHIVSHGDTAQLQLGATQLNQSTLRDRSADFMRWKDSFTERGDVLIYGCKLADTAEGKILVDSLSFLTATDVAASDDLTGSQLLGGDWDLEYEAGDIETAIAFSDDIQQHWQGTLDGAAPAAPQQEKPAVEEQPPTQDPNETAEYQAMIDEEEQTAVEQETRAQQAAITEQQRNEVIFVDESVSDFQSLIDSLQADSKASTTFDIFLLDGNSSGIHQIDEILSSANEVHALHILSHGDDGAIKLGDTWLNANNLEQYSDSLAAWGDSLDQDADILIYGCNLAESTQGEQFVDQLAQYTGADVAASDDITGHASLGGDWELEYITGSVETSVAVGTDVQATYQGMLNTFIVSNTNATGAGSFHQAILDANANTGVTDTISFNIPGAGPHVISLTGALPAITEAVIIDGTSEPDFSYAGDGSPRPVVVIDGSVAGAVDGIVVGATGGGTTIRGLVIQNFQNDGILLLGGNNTIVANILGLQADGSTIAGNNLAGTGIHGNIRIESSNNIIGGLTPAERNIISGSGFSGIALEGAGATGNQILGNYIGTDITGTLAKGNAQEGIEIQDASGNTIGGTAPGARNIISANGSDGMEIDNGDNNIIQGNYIGTDVTGTVALGNLRDGIDINENSGAGSTGNLIGGTDPNAGNIIAGNGIYGVEVRDVPTVGNTILGNRIYDNGQIGIQLGSDGVVTVNDAGDADGDSNNLQNFPVLASAATNTVDTIAIDGTLNSMANSYFRLEFFSNSAADISGNGEGENYLGYVNVATDASGNASFTAVLSAAVADGAVISATATRSDISYTTFTDTSEFAANITAVTNNAPVDLQVTATAQGGASLNADGGNDVYYVADDGAGLLGGLTTVTIETSFSVTTPGADLTPLLSYADGANDEELALFLKSDGRIWFGVHSNGSPIQSTTGNYTQLFDGELHHVAVSWDSASGAVAFYVDGQPVESFVGYQTGQAITGGGELVFGQDQDSVLGGFRTIDVFSGSLYDVRIFNDVRTPAEIASGYDLTLPAGEPGMVANWTFSDMSTGGIVTDTVSGNNLTEQHVVGAGFSTSTPELTLMVREDDVNGTVIGSLEAIDPDVGETFSYSLIDDAGGRFSINGSNGQITLADASQINYESANSHAITVRVTDSGALTYDEVFTVYVINVNEAPVNSVPGTQVVLEDTQTAIAGISITDVDAGSGLMTTQLTVTNGVLDVTLSGAATISAGANGSSTMTISGNVTDINATLASLQYTGNLNVNGVAADTLAVVTNDQGNTGSGGAQVDSDNIQIDITAVNDVPVAIANTVGTVEDNPFNFTSTDFTYSDVETDSLVSARITNLSLAGGTLTHSGGTVVNNGDTLTAAQLDSLVYTPAADANGTPLASFDFTVNDSGAGVVAAQMAINVTASNDLPLARDDRIGLLFDGADDYVRIGDYPGLNVSTSLTLEAWIKPTGLGTGTKIIINKEGEYELAITSDTGEVKWAFDNTDPDWSWYNTGYFVQAGEWTHLAVTYSNGVVNTYANGVLVDTYNGSGSIGDNYPALNELQIGGRQNAVTQRFDGHIDEVRIWNTTRAQVDIQADMNSQLTGVEVGLIGNWRFDEGSGFTVADRSVFGHHGTLADGLMVAEMPVWHGYVVSEDTSLNVGAVNGVLANDYDIDGDSLTAVLVTGPANAAAFSLNPDGSFSYTPTANFVGVDTFSYRANDGSGDSNIAIATIRVDAVNDVPVASANTVSTTEDNAYTFTAADFSYNDVEGDVLVSATITGLNLAGGTLTHSGGTVVNAGDTLASAQLDSLIYTPAANANGTPLASFDFTVNDAGAGMVAAQMSINVTAQPDAAVIGGVDTGVVTEDFDPDLDNLLEVSGALTIIDPDVGEASFNAGVIGGTYGVITLNAGGGWDYAANTTQAAIQGLAAGATLTDTITVSSVDGTTHDIVITIMGTNDAPVAGNDVASVNEGASVIVDVAASDSDIDNTLDLNSIVITSLPLNGNVVVNGNGTVTYTHNGSETLSDSFSYTISDISGAVSNTATVTLTVNPVNDAPAANNDNATVVEGGTVLIDIAANDNDADSALDLNSIVITAAPLNGSLLVNGDGTVSYSHDGSNTVSDSFSYTIADSSGVISNTATVNITVTAVNSAPTSSGIADVSVNEDAAPTRIDLHAAFDDSDNLDTELTYTLIGNSNIGLFSAAGIDNASGQLTLNYAANMNGSAQIAIRASDPSGQFVDTLFTVTVNPVNDNPVLQANTGMGVAGTTPATISSSELQVTDIDNLNSELVYTVTALPASGELLLNGMVLTVNDAFTQADLDSNRVVYRATAAVTADQFGFTVSDGAGGMLGTNVFNIVVQLSQNEDTGNEPPPAEEETQDEDPPQPEAAEPETPGLIEDTAVYGDSFEPPGSTSVPPPPMRVETVPPTQQQPTPPQQIEPVEIDPDVVTEVKDYEVSTFSAVQVKSMTALWSAIDQMKQEMAETAEKQTNAVEIRIAAAETSGVVLTAGVVAWILRSGALFSSLLSTIPLWKGYDPLPILAYEDEEEEDAKEIIDENKIPTSMDDLKKLKELMKQKEQHSNEVDVDSMFGGSITRE